MAAVADEVTVLHGGVVVTMDGGFRVFRDGAVAVAGDRIAAVGPSADVLSSFPGAAATVDLAGRILFPGWFLAFPAYYRFVDFELFPQSEFEAGFYCFLLFDWGLVGFVNTHVHTSQQLARGIADDVDLMTWLHGRIWPYESHMMEEDSYASTLLCGIELIRSGVS
jgi:cytosine/adenosine deaminase-related metal-dependent hydrolase